MSEQPQSGPEKVLMDWIDRQDAKLLGATPAMLVSALRSAGFINEHSSSEPDEVLTGTVGWRVTLDPLDPATGQPAEQLQRVAALEAARNILVSRGFASSSAPNPIDLYSIARFILTGEEPWKFAHISVQQGNESA